MYSANKFELMDKFYIFALKNQTSEQSEQLTATNENLVTCCNPEKLLYGICLSVYDYIESVMHNQVYPLQDPEGCAPHSVKPQETDLLEVQEDILLPDLLPVLRVIPRHPDFNHP
jgi:hypothetical protein